MSASNRDDTPEMAGRKIFELVSSAALDGSAARLGRLSLPGKKAMDTPNFFALTSRGAVPHLTPDNLKRHTSLSGVYMALEDFIEKKEPPVYQTPGGDASRRLHQFTALPPNHISILGPRRCPAVTTPYGNTPKAITVFTCTGFRSVTVPEYASAVRSLQPDIVLPMADLLHTSATPPSKKLVRMTERTEVWLDEFLDRLGSSPKSPEPLGSSVFAPVLSVEYPIQWDYLRHLSEDVLDKIEGLAVYGTNLLPELANYPPLTPLPKLSMDPPKTPHEVLRQISLGIDICTIGFVNGTSDAGVAMTFSFPPPSVEGVQPLGINMWSPEHKVAVVPLLEGCPCYTCTKHHRAYIHHLLNAKEMLGWNLLQIHNHHVITEFFAGIREALARGGQAAFEDVARRFAASYEPALPEGTGERPRARGYHFKSEASADRINKPAWVDLDKEASAKIASLEESNTPGGESRDEVTLVVDVEAAAAALSIS
ncbi:tRNA-guanine transglycosylase [Trichoderma citrinoviride]|uniref:Queuine tRNA-ribosyltransferase accessory subunit 2 n=1 Tax=Trichoderma citrinoviride TaxID=58853 RepID=A0A2T4B0I8_9HYPO|nr:tRNA-guanine transglycosylase [Trichoderma citrinoviride]PTB62837.1 tRNA-guanine transglycosylase [Trichoderma citrinoviride]